MPTWQEVQALRKAGQAEEALRLALVAIAGDSADAQMKIQGEWAAFDLVKKVVARILKATDASAKIDPADLGHLYGLLQDYVRLKPIIPGMACSNILHQTAKIGKHFEKFLAFLRKCGPDCLRPEDFHTGEYQGRVIGSWALGLAREAAAWVKARPASTAEDVSFALDLARAVRAKANDADKTWLDWDLAVLLRRVGDRHAAAKLIVGVLRRKRTEFWAWAEAGRIHSEEQPELAIACFCQALSLDAEPKFVGKVHRELAELLAEAGEVAQATREAIIAVEIYDGEGWRHPPELETLLQSDWYDPSLAGIEPRKFYGKNAEEALTLCFDEVREYPATYLGMTEGGQEGKKPKPRFAFRSDGVAVSILGRRGGRILKALKPGGAVTLLVGIEAQRRDVLEVLPRSGGGLWDCTETRRGVVAWLPADGANIAVYCGRDLELRVPAACNPMLADIALGAGVTVSGAINPANERFEVSWIELAPVPEHADIGVFSGELRRNGKGFGFIEGVFVPAPLIGPGLQDVLNYTVVAVQAFDKKKERYSWRAVAVRPCQ